MTREHIDALISRLDQMEAEALAEIERLSTETTWGPNYEADQPGHRDVPGRTLSTEIQAAVDARRERYRTEAKIQRLRAAAAGCQALVRVLVELY